MFDLNDRQMLVMVFIKRWAEEIKTPIPQSAIIKYMKTQKTKSFTALGVINALINKGYIRRGVSGFGNRSYYVMIRNI